MSDDVIPAAREVVHRAYRAAMERGASGTLIPSCATHDNGYHAWVCDEMTAAIEHERLMIKNGHRRTPAAPPEPTCVRCLSCKQCVGACDCTGGPRVEQECTCYESWAGHQPGCYFHAHPVPGAAVIPALKAIQDVAGESWAAATPGTAPAPLNAYGLKVTLTPGTPTSEPIPEDEDLADALDWLAGTPRGDE